MSKPAQQKDWLIGFPMPQSWLELRPTCRNLHSKKNWLLGVPMPSVTIMFWLALGPACRSLHSKKIDWLASRCHVSQLVPGSPRHPTCHSHNQVLARFGARLRLQINRTKHQRSEHQRATDQLLYRSTKTGRCIEHYTNKFAPQVNCSTHQQI